MELLTGHISSLTPAFGADYKSAKAVTEAFLAGKDFTWNQHTGRSTLVNVEAFGPGARIQIRYNRIQSVMVLDLDKELKKAAKLAAK